MDSEYNMARELQEQFLPLPLPTFMGLSIDYTYKPSPNISGDFFDMHSFGKNKLGFIILDVVGKGLPAIFITIRIHSLFHSLITPEQSPKEVLSTLNKELSKLSVNKKSCACVYLELNIKEMQVKYADAGMGVAYLCRENTLIELRAEGGLMLGMMADSEYTEGTIGLHKDDVIIIGSDGLTDIENEEGIRFGDDRLNAILKAYQPHTGVSIKQTLDRAFETFSASIVTPKDDLTFLTFEILKETNIN